MVRRIALAGLIYFTSVAVCAAGLDIRVSDEAAQLEYLFDSDSQIGIGGADIGAAVLINDKDDIAATFGAVIMGSSSGQNRALQLGAGARIYAADLDRDSPPVGEVEDSAGGLAIGGKISYIFPSHTPMAVTAEVFYAPEITSFGDSENLLDALVRFEIEVAPSTRLYVGYRLLETELKVSHIDYELDDSAHIGVRLSF